MEGKWFWKVDEWDKRKREGWKCRHRGKGKSKMSYKWERWRWQVGTVPSSQGLSGGGHGHGQRGDGNKKGSGGGRELHTSAMVPCYYAGYGLNARRNKNCGTGRHKDDKNWTDGVRREKDARKDRMTQMSIADGKRRRMARSKNRWHPETVSPTSGMTEEVRWKILVSARCLTVYSSLRQLLRASRQARCQPAVVVEPERSNWAFGSCRGRRQWDPSLRIWRWSPICSLGQSQEGVPRQRSPATVWWHLCRGGKGTERRMARGQAKEHTHTHVCKYSKTIMDASDDLAMAQTKMAPCQKQPGRRPRAPHEAVRTHNV